MPSLAQKPGCSEKRHGEKEVFCYLHIPGEGSIKEISKDNVYKLYDYNKAKHNSGEKS
jgi:hypothetical protein